MKSHKPRLLLALLGGMIVLSEPSYAQQSSSSGELLYNGIRLPADWPPRQQKLTRQPMAVPYLQQPPDVIPINLGRQLFVDDFLVAQTNLRRRFHQAKYHSACPVLKPDRDWEKQAGPPTAMVFSDGVWYDPIDQLFKMWYMGGYCRSVCYAQSKDGIHWEKPALDVQPGTNVVWQGARDSNTVWLDWEEKDPQRRWKLFTTTSSREGWRLSLFVSADGIHWKGPVASSPPVHDRTTVFYNPFRKVWVYSIRTNYPGLGRVRLYREHPDAQAGLHWKQEDLRLWIGADQLDPHNPNPELAQVEPQLYNLDCFPYESLLVGLFSIWQGDWHSVGKRFQKRNEVFVGFSRDGFHWDRPWRKPLFGVDERPGAWNWANVQSCGGGCLVVGDHLYFYLSAREQNAQTGQLTTGLAILRRDGFASMEADQQEGFLITRPVRFDGKYLFVNLQTGEEGYLLAEVLDEKGLPIAPFLKTNCEPIRGDKTLTSVHWKGVEDLSALAGRAVRFRFFLRNGSLYAFWVSPDQDGASYGYVAAGGPGLPGPIDTVGRKSDRPLPPGPKAAQQPFQGTKSFDWVSKFCVSSAE
ncbi:MAG: hypothetical protein RMI90_12510 [Thermoguttaceae bacterium]|nr:hypothetical protein [Thermoguttaceae bacterium]